MAKRKRSYTLTIEPIESGVRLVRKASEQIGMGRPYEFVVGAWLFPDANSAQLYARGKFGEDAAMI